MQDKPAGLLGRNSQIEEEESIFLALSGWMQEAKSKQKALKEAAELRAKETASAAASTDNDSVTVGECEVLKLADTGKVHDEEVSDIEDDDLSGSDVELKFSDEDDDDESDGSDGEKSAVLQEPRLQKIGFALNLSQIHSTSEPGVSLRRTPPMLGTRLHLHLYASSLIAWPNASTWSFRSPNEARSADDEFQRLLRHSGQGHADHDEGPASVRPLGPAA
jgi:hypothetical protein